MVHLVLRLFLCFVDRESSHKFLLITNLMHFFMYLFIHFISLHISSIKRSSSGDRILLIYRLVWLACVSNSLICRSLRRDRHTKLLLTQANHTRRCINKIRSPDDERLMLEMCREMKWINKYMKKCIRLVINKNYACLWIHQNRTQTATRRFDYPLLGYSFE